MPRKKCHRNVTIQPGVTYYKPAGIPLKNIEEVILHLDELEAIRLADYDEAYQEVAAKKMGISRQTFGRILKVAHKKVADAIVHGKAIRIEGELFPYLDANAASE